MADPTPARTELEAASCWEPSDRVPGRPLTTDFRRATRLDHASWRVAHGYPIGSQPISPKPGGKARPVGSRLDLDFAESHLTSFVTAAAKAAVEARLAIVEPHQSIDRQRLQVDLLSSPALAFNLFADLAADHDLATRALDSWFEALPGPVLDVRFLHSPGRLEPNYLNNLRHFYVMFVLDLGAGDTGAIAVGVGYHERNKAETPRPENLGRYRAVAERSGIFRTEAIDELCQRSEFCVLWLQHLLALSMLQHPEHRWRRVQFALVRPDANPDLDDLHHRYLDRLTDRTTASTFTIDRLLDSENLPAATTAALRERYLPRPTPPDTTVV